MTSRLHNKTPSYNKGRGLLNGICICFYMVYYNIVYNIHNVHYSVSTEHDSGSQTMIRDPRGCAYFYIAFRIQIISAQSTDQFLFYNVKFWPIPQFDIIIRLPYITFIYIYYIHSHTPNVLFVTFLNKNRPCWVMAPKLYIYLFFHYFLPLFPSLLTTKFMCPFPSFSLTMDREVVDGSGAGRCLYNLYVPRCSRPEGFYHITGSLAPGVNNVEKWIQHFWTVFMGSCFSLLLFSSFFMYI